MLIPARRRQRSIAENGGAPSYFRRLKRSSSAAAIKTPSLIIAADVLWSLSQSVKPRIFIINFCYCRRSLCKGLIDWDSRGSIDEVALARQYLAEKPRITLTAPAT